MSIGKARVQLSEDLLTRHPQVQTTQMKGGSSIGIELSEQRRQEKPDMVSGNLHKTKTHTQPQRTLVFFRKMLWLGTVLQKTKNSKNFSSDPVHYQPYLGIDNN